MLEIEPGTRVRLVDGAVVTFLRYARTGKRGKISRARVRFAAGIDMPPGSPGHERTVKLTEIIEIA